MKPRIKSIGPDWTAGPWLLDFGDRVTATLVHDGVWRWTLCGPSANDERGEASGQRFALLEVCCRAARRSPPPSLGMLEIDVLRLARSADGDTSKAVGIIRDLLLRRTGKRWSVRQGKGSQRDAILIRSMPSRCEGGVMPWADCVELAAVTGRPVVNPSSGVTVSARVGSRTEIIRSLAGAPAQTCEAACG